MVKKLGFGCMRMPLLDSNNTESIDKEQMAKMIDKFIEEGFTYFDTSYVYHNGLSEKILEELLVKRYPRDKFTITTKLPSFMVNTKEEMQKIFDEQLERLQTDYVDYYWLHAINEELYNKMGKVGFEFLQDMKKAGKTKHIGFSFHDSSEVLDKILTEHPEVEYVQLQLNYIDWTSDFVQSGKCYEVCKKHNVQVVVMEPVKGGGLVNLPEEADKIYKEYNKDASNASWAIRWAASFDNVFMVLSGMSNIEQVNDNTSFMKDFVPMNDKEKELVQKVADIINKKICIDIKDLEKCDEVCPQNIPISTYMKLYNEHYKMDCYTNGMVYYNNIIDKHPKASACIKCGKCNQAIENKQNIMEYVEKCEKSFEF